MPSSEPPRELPSGDDVEAAAGTLEERRLRLEEARYALEYQKVETERSRTGLAAFVNNNLGIVVSAIVGFATIVVSALQLRISTGAARAQFDLEQSKFAAATVKDDRAFAFDFARFLLEKQAELNTTDITKVAYLRNVVIATLPVELGTRISRSMADSAPSNEVRAVWLDGFVKLQLATASAAPDIRQGGMTAAQVIARIPQIASAAQRSRLTALLDAMAQAGISDPRAIVTILAVVLPQTEFLSVTVENLDYSSVPSILATWPWIRPEEAAKLVHQPEALANRVYANKLGNSQSDDGWRYRGRGFLGVTGRANYQRAGSLIDLDLIANPDALADDRVAARQAVAFVRQLSIAPDDIIGLVRHINGGLTGLATAQSIVEKLLPGGPRVTEGLAVSGAGGIQGAE